MRKKLILMIFIIFTCKLIFGQITGIDPEFRKNIVEHKSKFYQKILKSQQQCTANQENYDVKYYALDLTPNIDKKKLYGKVQVLAEVITSSLDMVELNLWTGMTIDDIYLTDSPETKLTYNFSNNILAIDLDKAYNQSEHFNLTVEYYGRPQDSGFEAFDFGTYNNNPMIWTLSDPMGARSWWPCKDIPADKADSVDIRVTVDKELIVASNGTLRDTTINGDKVTYWWHEQYPIVTYLVSLAIHPYTVYSDWYIYGDNDSMEVQFYVFPDEYYQVQHNYAKTVSMIEFYSGIYGQYPFIEEKYGHASFLWGGGMEHQTITSLGGWGESLIAHELAHQWWGDYVTCNTFHHIWLNEGFATYSEALWFEHAYPPYTSSQYQMEYHQYLGSGTIFVEDPTDFGAIFNQNLSYNKASWVLHMLRHIVGDDMFFEILQSFNSSPEFEYGTATTEEFQGVCEQISGFDLEKFFQQWIYSEYYPEYGYGWNTKTTEEGYRVKIGIEQIQQNTGLFWMPIDIKLITESYDTTFTVWDSLQYQNFEFDINDRLVDIEIDQGNWILKKTKFKMISPYPINITLNNTYQVPDRDILKLFCETENLEEDDLILTAYIENFNNTIIDSFQISDNGLDYDNIANDGFYAGFWSVPAGEAEYNIHIKTLSVNSGYTNLLSDAIQFTTLGPIAIDTVSFPYNPTPIIPGDHVYYTINLKNNSPETTIDTVKLILECDAADSLVEMVSPRIHYGNILPGEIKEAQPSLGTPFGIIKVKDDCPGNIDIPIKVDIYSADNLYWSEDLVLHINEPVSVNEKEKIVNKFALYQNYPNPFNPSTTISYELARPVFVKLSVFDINGSERNVLVNKQQNHGHYSLKWNAENLESGVYFIKIQAGDFNKVNKCILIK